MSASTISHRFRAVAVAMALGCASSCSVNPVTGERELALVSESQEISMGREAAEQVKSSIGLVDDAELQRYVNEIGQRIARSSERPDLPWEFHVVNDPTPNAFALPGGYIFVTRGLMTLLNSEAELAAVLGHEVGHVTARHSVAQISRAQLAQLGLGIGAIAAPEAVAEYGELANQGVGLLFLKYGRDDERQADNLGFRYMLDHGYDVREMEHVFAALDASSELAGASPVPTWLATHPSGPERIEALRSSIASLDPNGTGTAIGRDTYLAQVNGLAYGADPRDGYFDGDTFYHPDMAFEFLVPSSWQRRNTAGAVLAASPERDAALQLTLARGSDASAAAAEFLQSTGVAELRSQTTRINGHRAAVTHFAAASESSRIEGLAAHIEYPDAVYRLIVYGPSDSFAGYGDLAERIVQSFAPVDDPAVLEVETRRLRIVNVERDMSLSEFSRRYPSAVTIDELAVLNQLDGPSAQLLSGQEAKQVTG